MTSHPRPARHRSPRTRRRAISLKRRFRRFLLTIPWPSFGTIQPTRGRAPGVSRTWRSSDRVLVRSPRRRTSLMSRVRRIRAERGNRSCVGSVALVPRPGPGAGRPAGLTTDSASASSWTRCGQQATAAPAAGACSGWRVRPSCSCAPGNRACSSACGSSACTWVSSFKHLLYGGHRPSCSNPITPTAIDRPALQGIGRWAHRSTEFGRAPATAADADTTSRGSD